MRRLPLVQRFMTVMAAATLIATASTTPASASEQPAAEGAEGAVTSAFHSLPYSQVLSTHNTSTKLSNTSPLTVKVAGTHGVPNTGVSAVSLDVTTSNSVSSSWVSLTPSDGGSGITNHFTTPGRQAQNNVYVAPSGEGEVTIHTGGGTTDVVIAITGYFSESTDDSGSLFVPASEANRLIDTRASGGHALAPGESLSVLLPDSRPAGTNAAAFSVTTLGATRPGWLAISNPDTSTAVSLDYDVTTASSSLIAGVGTGGYGTVTNRGTTPIHVVVDLQGYFSLYSQGGVFISAPAHAYDSRVTSSVPAGGVVHIPIAGVGGVPLTGVTAYALDVTVLSGGSAGYAQVYPASLDPFGYATINFEANDRRSNSGFISAVSPETPDAVAFRNRSTTAVHVLVDVVGYFTESDAPAFVDDSKTATPDSTEGTYSASKICRFNQMVDQPHISTSKPGSPRAVQAHGGWGNVNCNYATAVVTTRVLKRNSVGIYVGVGADGVGTLKAEAWGKGKWVTARYECQSKSMSKYKSWTDADIIGIADSPNRTYYPYIAELTCA